MAFIKLYLLLLFFLFDLMLYIPINSYGHVGTLPPYVVLLPNIGDVMTSEMSFGYNHPIASKQLCMDGVTGHFSWAGSDL